MREILGVHDAPESVFTFSRIRSGPDLPHCWQNNLINAEDAAEWFTIQFDRELLPVNMETMIELQAVSQMLKRASGGLKFQSVPDSVYLNNDCTATIREERRF